MNQKPNLTLLMKIREKFRHQYVFAGKVGVSDSLVSKVILGRRNISEADQRRWARTLGCKAKDIWGLPGDGRD